MIAVRQIGPEHAETMLTVVQSAFRSRPVLEPPADALQETTESLAALLAAGTGFLVDVDGEPAGALVVDLDDDTAYLRRVGVVPEHRRGGVAAALIRAALAYSAGVRTVTVLAREELPSSVEFWRHHGFREVGHESPYVRLSRPGLQAYDVPDADAMRALGKRLAPTLRAGDLVVLTGGLGAGKTTFTQGLGAGLGVRGDITSPTFVIARVHPSVVDGPALVHVDAYRLGGIDELDDLDLDASLDEAVTVVEWGAGVAEGLTDSRLEIYLDRAEGTDGIDSGADSGADSDIDSDIADPRRVYVGGVGPRWDA